MTVYVDDVRHYPFTKLPYKNWCHLFADDLDELHAMAQKLGMRPSYFQRQNPRFPHYDLVPSKRAKAVELGAVEVADPEMFALVKTLDWVLAT